MSPQDKQDIVESLIAALQAQPVAVLQMDDPDEHAVHHRYIELLIEREQKRTERWEGVRKQVLGWGIVILLSAVGTSVYQAFIAAVNRGGAG